MLPDLFGRDPRLAQALRQPQLPAQAQQSVFQIAHRHRIGAARHARQPRQLRVAVQRRIGIAGDHRRQQHCVQPAVGHMEQAAQAVGDGMAHPKPRMGEGDARHGGGQMHPQPHLPAPRVGGGEHRIGNAEALPGVHVRKCAAPCGGVGLQRMGQHIKAGIRDQPRRQRLQQVAVQDSSIRAELFVHQRMLCPAMGQDRKIRDLRAGAGGGGNGHQREIPLGEIGHGLGAVHGAAASQCSQQIRPELL